MIQSVFSYSSVCVSQGDDCRLLDVMLDRGQGVSVQFDVMTQCTALCEWTKSYKTLRQE